MTRQRASASRSDEPGDLYRRADRLIEVLQHGSRTIRRQMRNEGAGGLTALQVQALLHVKRHPSIGLSGLAEHLGITLSGTSTLVDRLVKAGQLRRAIDPNERRRIQISLTRAGEGQLVQARERARGWLLDRLSSMDAVARTDLDDALDSLDALLEDKAALSPHRR